MAWVLGSFTFSTDPGRHPDLGSEVNFDGGALNVSEFNPIGYTGTILTFLGRKGERHQLHIPAATVADKNSLKAIYEAEAAVAFTDYIGSHGNVVVTEFTARTTAIGAGQRYEITMTLVAQ